MVAGKRADRRQISRLIGETRDNGSLVTQLKLRRLASRPVTYNRERKNLGKLHPVLLFDLLFSLLFLCSLPRLAEMQFCNLKRRRVCRETASVGKIRNRRRWDNFEEDANGPRRRETPSVSRLSASEWKKRARSSMKVLAQRAVVAVKLFMNSRKTVWRGMVEALFLISIANCKLNTMFLDNNRKIKSVSFRSNVLSVLEYINMKTTDKQT